MKTLRILLGTVALALASSAVHAQTPAPVPSSTQTPVIAATPVVDIAKSVGTSGAWLKKALVGTCLVNPASIASGGSSIVTCSAIGALTTDVLFVQAEVANAVTGGTTDEPHVSRDCWYIQSSSVTAADTIAFRIANREMQGVQAANACDPPALTVKYFAFRPNKQY